MEEFLDTLDSEKDSIAEIILECPVCYQFPELPMWGCVKGHRMCNKCWVKMYGHQCVQCRLHHTKIRNALLQSVYLTSNFVCDYQPNGCALSLRRSTFDEHKHVCDFRPLKCHLVELKECKEGVLYGFSDYFKHLLQIHKIRGGNGPGVPTLSIQQTCRKWKNNSHNYWNCKFKEFDGKVFIASSYRVGSNFFWSMSLIGGDEEAKSYRASIAITNFLHRENMPIHRFNVPIQSIRRFKNLIFDRKADPKPFAIISEHDLLLYATKLEGEDTKTNTMPSTSIKNKFKNATGQGQGQGQGHGHGHGQRKSKSGKKTSFEVSCGSGSGTEPTVKYLWTVTFRILKEPKKIIA